ncbi:MAG: ATP-dependent helicase UvrD/PcrA [Patescibacteria group bacterium]|nr:ATP-dependent helicase UvrD/PcrA [Patescibacteria group bacterium]
MGENNGLLSFAETILKQSKLVEYIVRDPKARERLESVAAFFELLASVVESNPEAKLLNFLEFLSIAKKHKIVLKKKRVGGQKGKVRLLTAHKAKGLEFEYVYIVGAYDGHFGGRHNRDKLKLLSEVYKLSNNSKIDYEAVDDDDERRLFYVALTRAKAGLTITYSVLGEGGKEQSPSRFVTDLNPELIEYVDVEKWNVSSQEDQVRLLLPAEEKDHSLKDKEFIAELFAGQGLSVTALNNYLICPWQYFYRNLIRLPAIPEKHQLYGSAIHGALQDVFARAKDKGLNLEGLLASFERRLKDAPLSHQDFLETLAKGQKALAGWHETYSPNFNFNVLTEFKIKGVLLTSGVKLVGNLDKIEFLESGNNVNVVDYKTGKPKSRNQILGETKEADGNYFRQLVFYQLLLNLFEDGKYQMVSGEIDFIEPNSSGKYKKEKFKITGEQVQELKKTIEQVANEILSLSFWNKTCADPKCDYCRLRELMK